MYSALMVGVILGLSAGFAPGPLLTLVITQTLRHNAREGIKIAGAPVLTDVPIILLSLYFFHSLSNVSVLLGIIAAVGGLYVLYLSYETLSVGPVSVDMSGTSPRSLRKGIFVNALNPHAYLFWITVGAPYTMQSYERSTGAPWVFIGSFYLFLIGSKVLIAVIVGKFSSFLGGRVYLGIMRALGVLLAGFAIYILWDALKFFGLFAG